MQKQETASCAYHWTGRVAPSCCHTDSEGQSSAVLSSVSAGISSAKKEGLCQGFIDSILSTEMSETYPHGNTVI